MLPGGQQTVLHTGGQQLHQVQQQIQQHQQQQQQLRSGALSLNIGALNGAQLFTTPSGGQQIRFATAPNFITSTGQIIGGQQALLNMGQFQVGTMYAWIQTCTADPLRFC